MEFLSKQQILAAEDIQVQEVTVPEWGGKVLVRGMSGKERGQFTEAIVDQRGKRQTLRLAEIQIRLCAQCIVEHATGARMFSDDEIAALAGKSAGALQRVAEVAQRLSGLSDDDLDELTKNSSATQSDASPSA